VNFDEKVSMKKKKLAKYWNTYEITIGYGNQGVII
jgi:hypothetical protein